MTKPSRQNSVRRFKYGKSHTFTIDVDTTPLDDMVANLEGVEEHVRPVAQAMAQVFYERVQYNVRQLGNVTGNLLASIYQKFIDEESGPLKSVYTITWRTDKTGLPRAPHGHLIENGHWQKFKVYLGKDGKWYTNKKAPLPEPKWVGPKPFIRPAAAFAPQALDAGEKKLVALLGF